MKHLILSALCLSAPSSGFAPTGRGPDRRTSSATAPLGMEGAPRDRSRFEGMQREPTAQDISVMDDMITKMASAPAYELPNAVSKAIRVVSSPRFFLRIAERADAETDPDEKERLSALADNLVTTIQAVVSMTEDNLDERAKDVEKIVKAASEPDSGEFLVPLSVERVDAMRAEVEALDEADLNEGFLSTVDSWMNKAHQVEIMQKALQIYAGTVISRARVQLQANVGAALSGEDQATAEAAVADQTESEASRLLERLLRIDTDIWESEIRAGIEGDVTKESLVSEVQKTMEGVILGLENGSMAQRVQAEFLRELVTRIEAI
ncbi:hypothetical protein THAOC_31284 [Thalassiosira oceanica]|uniref:Uncharacterized protein n=1 Tax=Thalassiosira oceanica TaxID=159749 RepID=K0R9L8_THAOC|nr:hypothetical protein THAOC_31284 [Thalassiosira oceanica]|eukprot:EJK49805.1 hypothetical protein THAOC_31284 [Thalassiosira oceanica]